MRSLRIFICCALLAPLFAAAAAAQTLSIVTTPSGSFTNSAGAAIAKVISEKTKLRALVQPQALAAMSPVAAGIAEFGMSNAYDLTFFATGTAYYQGQPKHPNLRQIAAVTQLRVALHVRKDSPIKTIADLKGRPLGAGFNAQKTIARTIEALLANANLTYDDVDKVLTPNVSRSVEDFISGRTDALFFALGSAPVKQAAATVGGLRVLPIDDSPEAVARIKKLLPGAYVMKVNPAPNLDGITAPTNVVAFDLVFFTRQDVPDDIVYAVTTALHDNKKDLAAIFRPMALFNPDSMAKAVEDVPFHPGALKYYREIGIAPKS
jgi:TRAP transporter TAXI family solute receptor